MIPNYQELSEGYLQGFTIEETFSKFGVESSSDSQKCRVKYTARKKIIQFYLIADAIKNCCTINPISRSDVKFLKKKIAKKTRYSEHSCTVTISNLIDAGFKPKICQLDTEISIAQFDEI
jgi:hypothetical protein